MDSTLQFDRSPADIFQDNLKTVYRIAYTYMGNTDDAEEATQRTFAKYLSIAEFPTDSIREKNELIVKVTEVCFNMLKRNHGGEDSSSYDDKTIKAMVALPDKYKTAAYLFFCEGCTARDIAEIMDDKASAVSAMIGKARLLLKVKLGGGFDD